MNEDRLEGAARNLGGKVEQGFGRATGDAKLQAEGKLNEAAGVAQNLYGQAQDAANEAVGAVQDAAREADDRVRTFIETRPYTAAIGAFCAGFLIACMRPRS